MKKLVGFSAVLALAWSIWGWVTSAQFVSAGIEEMMVVVAVSVAVVVCVGGVSVAVAVAVAVTVTIMFDAGGGGGGGGGGERAVVAAGVATVMIA